MRECYMCDQAATTKEHVPPRSFFPPEHRANLITVPSCQRHNNDNSMDVEYVRNIIALPFQTKEIGRAQARGPVITSFPRRPKLAHTALANLVPVVLEGQQTGVLSV